MISGEDRQLSPEEYIARHAHVWLCFSYHHYKFADENLGSWVRKVGQLLISDEAVARCREKFLTVTELAEVRRREAEEW